MNKLITEVIAWGQNKGIVKHDFNQAMAQIGKIEEETSEVADAISDYFIGWKDISYVKNEIGDLFVTAIMVSACMYVDPQECLQLALDKISKRTGKVVDGVFVKDD